MTDLLLTPDSDDIKGRAKIMPRPDPKKTKLVDEILTRLNCENDKKIVENVIGNFASTRYRERHIIGSV
jgi:hypothetical protein